MINKPGYKHTPLGWIPEEWEVVELHKVTDKKRPISYGIVQTGEPVKDGVKCVRVLDIVNGKVNPNNLITTSEAISNSYKRTVLKENDLIIALRGKIGEVALADANLVGSNLTRGVALISPVSEYVSSYLYQQLTSPHAKKVFERNLNGSALQELSIGVIRKIPLIVTKCKSEQNKIATILSTWDEAITKTQQLIAQLQHRNKGLMQALLTGKKRLANFSKPWKEIHLSEAFNERNETSYVNLDLLSVGSLGVYPQSLSEKRDTSNSDKAKYKRICPGDIGYNTMRMWQGRSALSSLEGIVSPAYTIVTPKEDQYSPFYAYLFKLPLVVNKFFRNSQGLVEDTLNCKFKDFAIVKVEVPEYEEQVAIAKVLTTTQSEVKAYEHKLSTLQRQKKGLMQKLLTGEVRVIT